MNAPTSIELEIDGQTVQVAPGSTVMDAARQLGRYIPHFCFHKKLSIAANCRMCMVEVEKVAKPLPACATPATAGMKVKTQSPLARDAQHGVMEFLLINHPLDCPICDQGGECQLQDLAVGYGQSSSQFTETKRVVMNKNLGPLINTDMTRCIHCTRCVRFGQEIAGVMELGMAQRGELSEITTFMSRAVSSELSGNVIDLCPVGALTSKPFLFSARSWEMSSHPIVSPHDSYGSSMRAQVQHNRIKRVLPLENEAINECWLADRDRFSYEGIYSEDRLLQCKSRIGRQWEHLDRQEALQQAAQALQQTIKTHGPQSVCWLASPQATLEELYLFGQLAHTLGCSHVDFRPRQSDARLDQLRQGIPWAGMPIADFSTVDSALVVGGFLKSALPLLTQRLRQAARNGAQVSFVDTGGDDPLISTLAHVRCAPSALVDQLQKIVTALANRTNRANRIDGTPDAPTTEAERIAQSLLNGTKKVVLLSPLLQADRNASTLIGLVQNIARLSGATLSLPASGANEVGGYVAGCLPKIDADSSMMFTKPHKAYVLLHCEPELDHPLGPRVFEALKNAETVIALTPFQGSIEDYAKIAIPIASLGETSGTYINMEGRIQSFQAVTLPQQEVSPGWKILRVLGTLLGMDNLSFADIEQVRNACLKDKINPQAAGFVTGLNNSISDAPPSPESLNKKTEEGELERIAPVPGYFIDSLVRRAPSLQKAQKDFARCAHLSQATLTRLNIKVGEKRTFFPNGEGKQGVSLDIAYDETVPDNCVCIAAGHPLTWVLGDASVVKIGSSGS